MSVVAIVAFVVSVLMVASRWLSAAKPLWNMMPHAVAVLLPGIVALIPQVVDQLSQSKTAVDLVSNVIAAVALVVVGLFPSHGSSSSAS